MQGYITSILGILQIMSSIKAGQDQKRILTCTENDWPPNWHYKPNTITSTEFCIPYRDTDCDIQFSYNLMVLKNILNWYYNDISLVTNTKLKKDLCRWCHPFYFNEIQ